MDFGKICMTCCAILLFTVTPFAEGQADAARSPNIARGTKAAVIAEVSELVIQKYVFPEVGKIVAAYLGERLNSGTYDKYGNADQFAEALWQDLQESSDDNHFFIEYNPERARLVTSQKSQSAEESAGATKVLAEKDRITNYGFNKIEIMKGNVGYLDLRYFSNPDYAGATAAAAMNFLANSDAVIIDLRGTPGGKEAMVQLLSSYFVRGRDKGKTLLNVFEQPYDGGIEQTWTVPYVPGRRMYDMELYVLTDEYTGSASEAFAYSMKALDRAVIIGDTTRGSAHDVDIEVIHEHFVMHLPARRPVNPITGTNWEHKGVEPDIAVPGEQALNRAYVMALRKILERSHDDDQMLNAAWAIDGVQGILEPVFLDDELMEKYAGSYGDRLITFENGELFYQRTGPRYRMIPLKENLFAIEGLDYFRIEIMTDKKGGVVGLVGLYDDGRRDPSQRTN